MTQETSGNDLNQDRQDQGQVHLSSDGLVATVTLSRPDRRNALDQAMWRSLVTIFSDLANDEGVRCVVLRGDGGSFSAGADIGEFETLRADPDGARAYGALMDNAYDAMRACPMPLIAAIDGPCTGAGLVLALLCDLRFASERSVFGAPVSRLGLAMPYPEFRALWQAAGPARTLELLFEARIVPAHEAALAGLVNRVAGNDDLDAVLSESLERILAGAPLVHRWHKQFSRRLATGLPLSEDEIAASYASFATEDYREGFGAFLEGRRPKFSGR